MVKLYYTFKMIMNVKNVNLSDFFLFFIYYITLIFIINRKIIIILKNLLIKNYSHTSMTSIYALFCYLNFIKVNHAFKN